MLNSAEIISIDPELRRLQKLLELEAFVSRFTYNAAPFFYCNDQGLHHVIWKETSPEEKAIIHDLSYGTALCLRHFEAAGDAAVPLDRQTIVRQLDGTFHLIRCEGSADDAPAITTYVKELPLDLQKGIMALQAIAKVQVFPERFSSWRHRRRTGSQETRIPGQDSPFRA